MSAPAPMDDSLAKKRYMIMNALRVGSIGALMLGLAIARNIVDAPYALGVALAVAGMLAFYFGPRALARRWKSDGQPSSGEDIQ